MEQKIVVDCLGHPCRFTQAKEHFHSFNDAQKKELRVVKRNVGDLLMNLNDRLERSWNASKAIFSLVQSIDGAEEPTALLAMLTEYEIDSANCFYELAGLVVAGFEGGNSGGEA